MGKIWRSALATGLLFPALILLVMGIGVGRLIDQSGGLGGESYLHFVAPGVVAAVAMQVASTEATLIFALNRVFTATVSTPVGISGLTYGYLLWVTARSTASSAVALGVGAALGAYSSPQGVLVLPVSGVVALAHAAPVLGFAASQRTGYGINAVSRLAVFPMFLGGGAFFPVEMLPSPVAEIARITPIWHGTELCRQLANGSATAADTSHLAYLALWCWIGVLLARRTLRVRLVT